MQEFLASKVALRVEWSRASKRIWILEGELALKKSIKARLREDFSQLENEVRGLRSEWEEGEKRALANNWDQDSTQEAFVNLHMRMVIDRA